MTVAAMAGPLPAATPEGQPLPSSAQPLLNDNTDAGKSLKTTAKTPWTVRGKGWAGPESKPTREKHIQSRRIEFGDGLSQHGAFHRTPAYVRKVPKHPS